MITMARIVKEEFSAVERIKQLEVKLGKSKAPHELALTLKDKEIA